MDADGSLAATRPTFGGSLLCTIYTLNYRPQMATVRPRVMPMPEREEKPIGRIITHPLGMVEDDIVTKILSFLPDRDSAKSNLAYADVVVAGGLGLGSPENFQLVRQLAGVLGAEYGCSRRWCRRAGSRLTGRSARRARRSGRSSISPPAFRAPSSTVWASRART